MHSSQKPAGRDKPRIKVSFRARLRTAGTSRDVLEMDGQIENVSSGGLYLRLPRSLGRNTKVNVVFRFSHVSDAATPAARVAVRGVVLRADPLPDGSCGVALAFRRYRLF
jgi:PilZ domain